MRNFTLTFCLVFALAVTASGQTTPTAGAVEKVATDLSQKMAEELVLNKVDYLKFNLLVVNRLHQAAEAEKVYAKDEAELASRLKEIENEYEEKVFKMLNSRQVTAYAQFKQKSEVNFISLVQKVSGKDL